ncbi:MAG: S6e family ribosomal protein [Candidatus Pacearchaeota archaeon]
MKLDIAAKNGKTYHYELAKEKEVLFIGKKIGEKIAGDELGNDFKGYEFEITGFSDIRGFPGVKGIPGSNVRKVLLGYGVGMQKRRPKGMRKKKSIHGEEIANDVAQVNLKIVKEGEKKIDEIIPPKEKKE